MRCPAQSKAGGQRRRLLPALLLALLALPLAYEAAAEQGSTPAAPPSGTAPLAPFHSVVSCLPFSLLIRPSNSAVATDGSGGGGAAAAATDGASGPGGTADGPAYSLRLDSTDTNITGAFEYSVTPDGTLHLSLSTPIVTNSCASAVVELPADALREVRATMAARFGAGGNGYLVTRLPNSEGGTDNSAVVIEGPFNLPSLTAGLYYEGQGDPRLVIRGATVDTLTLAAGRCTCGTVLFASGTFRDVRLHTQDVNCWDYDLFLSTSVPCPQPTAKVALVTERVTVNGSAMVVTPNASLAIEGTAGPLLIANAGICNLRLPSDNAWLPVQPCHITSDPPLEQAGEGAAAIAQQAGAFNATCGFDRSVYTTDGSFSECPQNSTQFDELSGLHSASAAVQPLPGPVAEEAVAQLLAHAHQLAALAAAGDADAAANLTGEAGRRTDPDLLVLLSEIAFSEGGREGALAACEEVNWGCVTANGCRNSFQRAVALLVNHNNTAGLRNALETGAEWDARTENKGKLSDPASWVLGPVWDQCPYRQWCTADFGGVRTPNATALMLAGGLTLAGGYFREEVAAAATAPYVCQAGLVEGCKQVRDALAQAIVLPPRLGYGSSQDVTRNAVAVSQATWRACVFGEAPPPASEQGAADGCGP